MTNHDQTTAPKTYRELTASQKLVARSITVWGGEKIDPKKSTFRTMRGGIAMVVEPFVIKEPVKVTKDINETRATGEIDMLALLLGE